MAKGQDLVSIAKKHVGEKYVFGAAVPKDNPNWRGPWDCAEFTSWVVYQASSKLYGTQNNSANPTTADSYTGYWARDAKKLGTKVTVAQASATPGACLLRIPTTGKIGHIAFSDGKGGTVEAMGTAYGVRCGKVSGRNWDMGVLVPWIQYSTGQPVAVSPPSSTVYRVTKPLMSGSIVKRIQQALKAHGVNPGPIDGVYGSMTASAVAAFQAACGVVQDGEVGPVTLALLGLG